MKRLVVYHTCYGCETGCCGHTVEWFDEGKLSLDDFSPYYYDGSDGGELDASRNFEFEHPTYKQDPLAWAKWFVEQHYGAEHVQDLDWDHCIVSDD